MIKVSCDKGAGRCIVSGDLPEIMADTSLILKRIYETIADKDEDMAKEWKKYIDLMVDAAFHPNEIASEFLKMAQKALNDLLNKMNEEDENDD